jgi:hypothetical protein
VLKLNGEQLQAGGGCMHQRLQTSSKPGAASVWGCDGLVQRIPPTPACQGGNSQPA